MRWVWLFILLCGCGTDPVLAPAPRVITGQLSLAQPLAATVNTNEPVLVMVTKGWWHIDWPEGFQPSNYVWTVELATNVDGPWVDQQQWFDSNTLLFKAPLSDTWFARLHGTTNTSQ